MNENKEDLIHLLQDEIIFLQTTKRDLRHYRYTVTGLLSETRHL